MNDKEQEGENVRRGFTTRNNWRLKKSQSNSKNCFHKLRRHLLTLLQRPDINREAIEDGCRETGECNGGDGELKTRYKIEKVLEMPRSLVEKSSR